MAEGSSGTSKRPWKLPVNGMLEFPRSDGDPSRRPAHLKENADPKGPLNYFSPIAHSDTRHVRWRTVIGTEVAKLVMGLTGGDVRYRLKDFPQDYVLYEKPRLNNDKRYDLHLYGSGLVKEFRSPDEFIKHAVWLFTDQDLDQENCKCTHCSGESQASIARQLGRKVDHYIERKTVHKPSPAIHRIREVVSATAPRQSVNTLRDGDLRTHDLSRPRVGEVVWCAIRPPIQGSGDGLSIEFWPAVVREMLVHAHLPASEESPSLDVASAYTYKVKLLGVIQSAILPTDDILPFQAYFVPPYFQQWLETSRLGVVADIRELSSFEPFPVLQPSRLSQPNKPQPRTFDNAWPAFCIALQTCSHIERNWTATDSYKHPVPPPFLKGVEERSRTLGGGYTRFQGLWWGPERIWEGELVRLNLPLTSATLEDHVISVAEHLTPGSETRCLFMRLDAIHYVESEDPATPGVIHQCWLGGRVYEAVLSSEDHVEASDTADNTDFASVDKGWFLSSPPIFIGQSDRRAKEYPLPPPPIGFEFRSVLPQNQALYVELTCLAGRYYPSLVFSKVLHSVRNTNGVRDHHLLSLAGYHPGDWWALNQCRRWVNDRAIMVENAEGEAKKEVVKQWRQLQSSGRPIIVERRANPSNASRAADVHLLLDSM